MKRESTGHEERLAAVQFDLKEKLDNVAKLEGELEEAKKNEVFTSYNTDVLNCEQSIMSIIFLMKVRIDSVLEGSSITSGSQ